MIKIKKREVQSHIIGGEKKEKRKRKRKRKKGLSTKPMQHMLWFRVKISSM